MEEQETKYCKRWYGKVALLAREKINSTYNNFRMAGIHFL